KGKSMIRRTGVRNRAAYPYVLLGLGAIASMIFDVLRPQRRAHEALERREEDLQNVIDELRSVQQQRARLLDEAVKAAEDERARVAAELHDGPIQQLTALALTLDL